MLGACSSHLQGTSGTSYLGRYDRLDYAAANAAATGSAAADVDADVRRIASIEPRLEFPARIGLARVGYGGLTAIPGDGQVHVDFAPARAHLFGADERRREVAQRAEQVA